MLGSSMVTNENLRELAERLAKTKIRQMFGLMLRTRESPNKSFNKQNNGCARALF